MATVAAVDGDKFDSDILANQVRQIDFSAAPVFVNNLFCAAAQGAATRRAKGLKKWISGVGYKHVGRSARSQLDAASRNVVGDVGT